MIINTYLLMYFTVNINLCKCIKKIRKITLTIRMVEVEIISIAMNGMVKEQVGIEKVNHLLSNNPKVKEINQKTKIKQKHVMIN